MFHIWDLCHRGFPKESSSAGFNGMVTSHSSVCPSVCGIGERVTLCFFPSWHLSPFSVSNSKSQMTHLKDFSPVDFVMFLEVVSLLPMAAGALLTGVAWRFFSRKSCLLLVFFLIEEGLGFFFITTFSVVMLSLVFKEQNKLEPSLRKIEKLLPWPS